MASPATALRYMGHAGDADVRVTKWGTHRYVNYAGLCVETFPHFVPPALHSPPAFPPQRHAPIPTPMCVHAYLRARYSLVRVLGVWSDNFSQEMLR